MTITALEAIASSSDKKSPRQYEVMTCLFEGVKDYPEKLHSELERLHPYSGYVNYVIASDKFRLICSQQPMRHV